MPQPKRSALKTHLFNSCWTRRGSPCWCPNLKNGWKQYQLQENGRYALLIKAKTGQVQSFSVADFEIPIRAIFDEAQNRAALQTILARRA